MTTMIPRTSILKINGNYLEGGGQILRNAFAYSTLLGKSLVIENIRGNRKPPGLRPQHATGLHLISQISSGSTLVNATKGSSTVTFEPGTITAGAYEANTETAGSTTLLLQVSLPCLLFPSASPDGQLNLDYSELVLKGGTNASKAPPIDFVQHVLFPFLDRYFGIRPAVQVKKRGYYPRGQGEIYARVPVLTKPLPSIHLVDRGPVSRIKGRSYVAGNLPPHIPRLMADIAQEELQRAGYDLQMVEIETQTETAKEAVGSGFGLSLWAETEGGCIISGSSIGERAKRAEEVGKEAADELIANLAHGGCTDEYLQDQIIIFMALAEGKSTVVTGPLSLHTRTAIWIAETMTEVRFSTTEGENGGVRIECEGIGFKYHDRG